MNLDMKESNDLLRVIGDGDFVSGVRAWCRDKVELVLRSFRDGSWTRRCINSGSVYKIRCNTQLLVTYC